MKKNYFMLVCLVLLSAFSANAQAVSVADLFGEYKFTADVEFASEDFKTSYGSTLLGESDVTIEADAQYAGRIVGFAGSQQKLNIRAINGNTIEMTNFNNPQLWNGLFMANEKGEHPNGVFDGEWVSYPYNTEYYEYNPETKVITVPTFTVVTVSENTVTVIATYKNAKLTYVGGDDEDDTDAPAFEWAGTHTLTAANVTAYDGNEYPKTFDVTIVKEAEGYFVTNIMGYDVTLLNNGGIAFTVAADGKSAQMTTGSYLYGAFPDYIVIQDMNASSAPINFVLQENGSVKVDNIFLQGLNYETNKTTPLAYYEGVAIAAAGGSEPEVSAFSWVGQHTVKVGSIDSYNDKSYPTEFTMTVIEDAGKYLVTEFFSTDVTALNYGGIAFAVAEDGKSAELSSASFVGGAYPDFLVIYDMNASESPIRFVLNDDGSVTIDNFCVKNYNFDSYEESLAALFKDVTIPAVGGSEPDVQEPAVKQYRVKCDNGYLNVYSTLAYPTGPIGGVNVAEFADDNNQIFTIEDAGNSDVYLKSASGLYIYCQPWNVDGNANEKSALTFEETTDGKFYIKCAKGYFKVEYVSNTPVATIDGVQTNQPALSGYFPYCDALIGAAALWTLEEVEGSTGIEDVEGENGMVKGIFDIQGRKIEQVVAPGLYIIDGKKVLVK